MSIPKKPDAAKLVISVFMNDKELFDELLPVLEKAFGPTENISGWFDFDYTDYYEGEMGTPLFRRMLSFGSLIAQDDLARIKETTNAMEKTWAVNGRRNLNLDPGYLLLSRFVLATGKDFSHRIYIGRGIYAEVTLMFKKGKFHSLAWTYPDYASTEMTDFLMDVRRQYVTDLK
ncbi:protein of unknown function [Desulfocicer vacuolatum DSM 3385]|uniref:DUF4416 domain-containing protein n=1 Tax=Desulfocicer vacuolatum DSM 3385 TaxID=1121400 RepID=A0A1W1Z825_9BACT|nr:DUF4416 family protein [Desulfocicer vacuolatum]SMC44555.1 protein of unknown function [Desulfocicer vacuolatum DSM 3385]